MKNAKRIAAAMLSLVLALLLFVQPMTARPVFAEERQMEVTLERGEIQRYHSYNTYAYALSDGTTAFCLEPSQNSPANGTYTAQECTDSWMRAAMYYGYGGPGFYDESLGMNHMFVEESRESAYIYTHMITSWIYDGASPDSDAFLGLHDGNSTAEGLMNIANAIRDYAWMVPANYHAFIFATGSGHQAMGFGYLEPVGYLKLTKTSSDRDTTDGNENYSLAGAQYGVYRDSGCTDQAAVLTTNESGESETVELEPGNYYVKEIQAPSGYQVNVEASLVTVVSGETQTVAAADTPYKGYARLRKVSAVADMTDGNACYSLAGAVYGVYRDEGCTQWIADLVTGENGASDPVELPLGTYYVREKTAPAGYALDTETRQVTVSAEDTAEISVADAPQSAPVSVILKKQDAETGACLPQGSATLAGAEFTVCYYDGIYEKDPSALGKKPVRTWVIQTDAEGKAALSGDDLLSGDALYHDRQGRIALPIGTVTICESRAPEGYVKNDTVFVSQIKGGGDGETIETEVSQIVPQKVVRGDVELIKLAEGENAESTDIQGLAGAEFTFTSRTTGKEAARITTDEKGYATTRREESRGALPYDTYLVEETVTPAGYDTVKPFEVAIREEGVTLRGIYLEDKLIVSPLCVVKKDATTGKTIPLAGTAFRVLDAKKQALTVKTYYPAVQETDTFLTDENGQFIFPEKLKAGTYYLEEVVAPKGYRKGELMKFEVTTGADWTDPLIVEYEDQPVRGRIQLQKTDSESKAAVEGAVYRVTAAEDIVTADGTMRLKKGDVADTLATDAKGRALSGELYPGQYSVQEVQTPDGYILSEKTYPVVLAVPEDEIPAVEVNLSVTDAPNHFRLVKRAADTKETLAGVSFRIWREDGTDSAEPEEYVTDKNGEIHVKGLAPGTYRVQETRALSGYRKDDRIFTFEVAEDGRINGQDVFTLTVENEHAQIVETTALDDGSGTHQADAKENEKIVDQVSMKNLIPGQTYVLRGIGMDRKTGEPLLVGGREVKAELAFTAAQANDTARVPFAFDATALQGKDIVFFEELYADEVLVSAHRDLKNDSQTVHIREDVPPEPTVPVKTGDRPFAMTAVPCVLILGALSVLAGVLRVRKKKQTGRRA